MDKIQTTRDALHPEYVQHNRRRTDMLPAEGLKWEEPAKPLPAPCLIDQLEVVATIGEAFQLKWTRLDWAKGLKVGDNLMAFVRPETKAET